MKNKIQDSVAHYNLSRWSLSPFSMSLNILPRFYDGGISEVKNAAKQYASNVLGG